MIFFTGDVDELPSYEFRKFSAFLIFGFIGLTLPTAPANADQEVEFTKKFSGKVADPQMQAARPASGTITDVASWQRLWVAWRPNEQIELVDFEKKIVLVEIAPGPNLVFTNALMLDDKGNLKYEVTTSRMAGEGFGYLVLIIPRKNITSVNGQPIVVQPETVAGQSGLAANSQPMEKIDTRPVGEESIAVEIVGGVRIGLVSAGTEETTGNMIAANNVVWELDFTNNQPLLAAAQEVGDSLARVKGKLIKKKSLGARNRWIINVESIERLDLQPPPRAFAGNRTPKVPAVATAKPKNPNGNNAVNPLVNPTANTTPDIRMDQIKDPAALNAFTKIKIVTSDGQTQIFNSDGLVTYESTAQNISNEWYMKPQTLVEFHQFMAQTDMKLIPRVTRGAEDEGMAYTISFETKQNISRIFIASSEVANVPQIGQFFGLVRKSTRDRK